MMVRLKTLPGDEGQKFARTVKAKRKSSKKAKTPEKKIQAQVEHYLDACGIEYLRLPDELYMCVFANPRVSVGVKSKVSRYIKGFPDILLMKNGRYLSLELKTESGKLSQKQRLWQKAIGTVVARSFEEAKELIDEWNKHVAKCGKL